MSSAQDQVLSVEWDGRVANRDDGNVERVRALTRISAVCAMVMTSVLSIYSYLVVNYWFSAVMELSFVIAINIYLSTRGCVNHETD